MPNWQGIRELRLGAQETLRPKRGDTTQPVTLGNAWQGPKPEFRNLRWLRERTGGFIHPGISHNRAELEFVKSKLKTQEQPWQQAWDKMQSSPYAALSWKPRPVAHVERGAYNRPDIGGTFFMRDATAAYTHALLWIFTGNEAHAYKSAEILDSWSATLESVSNHDARLLIGMAGIQFCNAAELANHNRMHLAMPWCQKAIERTRPECGGMSSLPWSTLMYADQPGDLVTLLTSKQKSEELFPAF